MRMTVGEIAKALGISNENIRYYVREGLISPAKNEENNYWEYSSEDVMLISDIMFYRSLGISIKNIKKIFNGLPLEEIGDIIEETREELSQRIEEERQQMSRLNLWGHDYNSELREIGRYRIGNMPPSYRAEDDLIDGEHIVQHLEKGVQIQKDDWIDVSLSFLCQINPDEFVAADSTADWSASERGVQTTDSAATLLAANDGWSNIDAVGDSPIPVSADSKSGSKILVRKYVSIEANDKMFHSAVLEKVDNLCLITKVILSDDVHAMIDPLVEYAKVHNFDLVGDIYGKEQTNYYVDHKRHWICTLYAPIK